MKYINKKLLWLIAARKGSKSIKNKNIKLLGGLPLMVYRIKSALSIAIKEDVWVTTDSIEYAELAKSYGANVPFIRPKELAMDNSSSIDVVLHAVDWAESHGYRYAGIGLLEPTSPFITVNQLINATIELFTNSEAENIVAVRIVHPHTFFIQENDKYLSILAERLRSVPRWRRQDQKDEITPSGGFYISKWEAFKKNKTFYTDKTLSFLVPGLSGLEIDESLDWLWAEFLLTNGFINKKNLFWCSQ